MVNTDGSRRDLSGGWGAILRDQYGDVIADAKGGGPPISINAHELQGVELGLNLALVRGHRRIHLAIDSVTIYLLLIYKDGKPPWNMLQIWRRVVKLREVFEVFKVSHVYRE